MWLGAGLQRWIKPCTHLITATHRLWYWLAQQMLWVHCKFQLGAHRGVDVELQLVSQTSKFGLVGRENSVLVALDQAQVPGDNVQAICIDDQGLACLPELQNDLRGQTLSDAVAEMCMARIRQGF